MENFFGFANEPAGAYSWQHLSFVTSLVLIMTGLAIGLGIYFRKSDDKIKNRALIICAIAINTVELIKIIWLSIDGQDFWGTLSRNLPLYLCSIQLIAIPLAAFTKGRIKEAALDFVMIFGILGALTGTYGAAQNYDAYPVLSVENVASGITHCISGFASLYIAISGLLSLKRKNMWITFTILGCFCLVAYLVNLPLGTNYMFLMSDDGTPYFLLTNIVNGNKFFYAFGVVFLFIIYISIFYLVFFLIEKIKKKKSTI